MRVEKKLTKDLVARKSRVPGVYGDGGGLYLRVFSPTAASWVFRYMLHKKAHEISLGPYPEISLPEAREKAEESRRQKTRGEHPKSRLATLRASRGVYDATFKKCAESYIDAKETQWRNEKHRHQWRSTLATYVYPIIGDKPVSEIDTAMVADVLQQKVSLKDPATGKTVERSLWDAKRETASRVRQRIEAVLDRAKALKLRSGENPATWRDNLAHVGLAKRSKSVDVEHHAALAYADLPDFVAELRRESGTAARALEFAILTAARTGEVIGARWDEIDMDGATWTIPAVRMKAKKEHRIPLPEPALALVREQRKLAAGHEHVFPGMAPRKPISNMSMLMLLRRMKRDDLTVHGFRSSFRDWTAERTTFPREVCEHALAHSLPDKTEAAYQRGDLFEKRAKLMEAWGTFCTTPRTTADNVRPIRPAA